MASLSVSIIIPVLNESKTIADALNKLSLLRSHALEIILVDGGSSDNTIELATPYVDKIFCCDAGRAHQMNLGAANARGDILWFLHADSLLPVNISSVIQRWQDSLHWWGFFNVQLSGQPTLLRWVERGMNWRSRVTSIATGDQGIFVQRHFFTEQGGYADIPLMEDVALCKKLRQHRMPKIESGPIITSSRRWENNGILTTIIFMWWLRLQYFLGVRPEILALKYYPHHKKNNINHPATIIQLAKSPTQKNVKTRLTSVLSLDQRQALHRALMECAMLQITKIPEWQAELHLSENVNEFKTNHDIKVLPQVVGDLGMRMQYALQQAVEAHPNHAVVLMGSDCPFIDDKYLRAAIQQLQVFPVVLGPALDGGYVLVGVRSCAQNEIKERTEKRSQCKVPPIFSNIPWGTSIVLAKTIERLNQLDVNYCLLPPLADIDRPEDLALLNNPILPQNLQAFAQE